MLTDIAIRRPVLTAMAAITVLVLGGMSFRRLGTEMFPDVSMPFVTILTIWPGAGPVDVEEEVTGPIEDAVAGINGVDELFSVSRESVSMVFVQFTMESDVDVAVQEVRERVGAAERELPHGVQPPEVARFDVRSSPVLTYAISAEGDPELTRTVAEDTIKPALEQIDGVALVRVLGGRAPEIQVRLDPARLEAHGLAAGQVFQRLQAENISIPSGRFETGPTEIGVRVDARIETVEDVERIVVSGGQADQLRGLARTVTALARGGQSGVASLPEQDRTPITIADVAEVRAAHRDDRRIVRLNGREAVIIEVVKRSGGNSVEVADAVRAALADLAPQLPEGIGINLVRDEAAPVIENAHDVERALVVGGIMAVLVILFFLVDLRGTLISALALPTSVVGTFALMYALGFTLNILTLLGLALAIGLLIDDSVVVREAITRRLEAGDDPFVAASQGTAEIRLAVLATTLTVCAVFVPVAFMTGMVGQFFKEFGLTVAGAVLLSLLVAFTLDPMLSARLAKKSDADARPPRIATALRAFHAGVDRAYRRALEVALRHPFITAAVGVASFVASIFVAQGLGADFVPQQDRGRFVVSMRFPPGTSLAESSRRSLRFEREMLEVEDITGVQCTVGFDDDPRWVRCNVLATPKTERSRTLQDLKNDARAVLARVPQATVSVASPPILEGIGDYPPIVMQVRGPELEVLRQYAERVAEALSATPGTADVDVRYDPGLPELSVEIDRERARHRGLSARDVAFQSRLALHGEVAGAARQGRRNVDIRVMMNESFRRSPESLEELLVYGLEGPVRLGDVADVAERAGPVSIAHESRRRQVSVHAQVEGRLGNVVADLRERLASLEQELPDGYALRYKGMQERMQESNQSMGVALLLALVFIYVILASQFESLVHPFTIVLSLPLGLLGAFVALWAWGAAVSLPAYLGLILLIGLCAKNGILLVDGAIARMREDGARPAEAMLLAGPRRLRPILMTSAAMIFGMLPTAVARDVGSEFRFPMAAAVIGGVVSNTLLTLFVLPVIFVWMERIARPAQRLWIRIRGGAFE